MLEMEVIRQTNAMCAYSSTSRTAKNTYLGIIVRKRQCVGHVQKRVGNRCIKLKKSAVKFHIFNLTMKVPGIMLNFL